MSTKQSVINILKEIPDPELNISIYDLGLIYDVSIDTKGNVEIIMTLTSVGCPLFDMIKQEIITRVGELEGISSVSIELTFEPPWSVEKMSQKARDQLGV